MLFTHDTEVALQGAVDLVNTLNPVSGEDALATQGQLDEFVTRWGWSGTIRHDGVELEQVRALRPRFREVWQRDEAGVVDLVNTMLADSDAQPRLVRHDDWDWHLHATPDDAPLATRMAVEFAMAMVDLVRARELGRLGLCGADDCEDVLVDLTRNRSRRFCSTTCGNRMAAAAYRERLAAAGTQDS
jgi:predicted RNA-binding Zn ribbon-like protein